MNCLDRPTKTKLKKLKNQAAAKTAVADVQRTLLGDNQPSNLIEAIAKSLSKRDKPSSILDTGYLGANIITLQDAAWGHYRQARSRRQLRYLTSFGQNTSKT